MSQGHLNLAKANFSNPNRIRYGKDYYDERMQASTQVFGAPESLFRVTHSPVYDVDLSTQANESETFNNGIVKPVSAKEQPNCRAENTKKPISKTNTKDPVIWFGVLVPPALRTSQTSFKDAVLKASHLAFVDTKMKGVEIEIRRTRKKLQKVG